MAKDISKILNIIHSTSSSAYQSTVPLATADNFIDVGQAVLRAPFAIKNEFMSGLYNKIGATYIHSVLFNNKLSFLKKQNLEYGQTVEEIYVGMAQAEPYITGMLEGDEVPNPFAIKKLPAISAFSSTILSRQYTVTRHATDLNKAFHSETTLAEFVAGMMNALLSGEERDDYYATIALMARQIEEAQVEDSKHAGAVHLVTDFNKLYPEDVVTPETAFTSFKFIKYMSNQLKKYSKRLGNLRKDFNIAGVEQILPQEQQRLMILQDLVVDFETELMAFAYHNGTFILNNVDEIPAWYSISTDADGVVTPEDIRVKATFTNKEGGSSQCVAVLYDPEMIRIYNKERILNEQENKKGNYWNMFLTVEDIYTTSPFKNFVAFMLD